MKKISFGTMVIRFFMVLWSLIIIVPFAQLFLTSIKNNEEFYAGLWTLPTRPIQNAIENFSSAWRDANMGVGIFNAVIICGLSLILTLTLSSMVSYAIARRHLRHENKLSNLYLIGLLVPAMVGLTPMFIMARFIGLFNTRTILVLLYTATQIPFSVFLMTAFFRSIPHELEEASYIDGASPWRTFTSIILPLARPAIVTAGIFAFLDFWSEYMYGLMFLTDKNKVTVAMSILQFKTGNGVRMNWGVTSAACVIFIAPILLLYCLFQKKIVGGLTVGSVKG